LSLKHNKYFYLTGLIIAAVLLWFYIASNISTKEENSIIQSINVNPNFKPNCDSNNNPLCKDQLSALEELDKLNQLQNALITIPIFKDIKFDGQREKAFNLKNMGDFEYSDNFFSKSIILYSEAIIELNKIEAIINTEKNNILNALDNSVETKRYQDMRLLIERLSQNTIDQDLIDKYEYIFNNSPIFDSLLDEANVYFTNELYLESITKLNEALKYFPNNQQALTLLNQVQVNKMESDINILVGDLKSLIFNIANISNTNIIQQKINEIKQINSSYDTSNFQEQLDDYNKRKANNILLEKANFHFNNEEFGLVVDNYKKAMNIVPLNKEDTNRLNIASLILSLNLKMQTFIDNLYDLKKETYLNELSNLIEQSKKVYSYSAELRNQTSKAETMYEKNNKFISVKINSSLEYFIKLEQKNLGSFEILNLKLRPGNYNVEIKRKKQITQFLQIFISPDNLDQEYTLSCNNNECLIL
jgi:hypothetical protein